MCFISTPAERHTVLYVPTCHRPHDYDQWRTYKATSCNKKTLPWNVQQIDYGIPKDELHYKLIISKLNTKKIRIVEALLSKLEKPINNIQANDFDIMITKNLVLYIYVNVFIYSCIYAFMY